MTFYSTSDRSAYWRGIGWGCRNWPTGLLPRTIGLIDRGPLRLEGCARIHRRGDGGISSVSHYIETKSCQLTDSLVIAGGNVLFREGRCCIIRGECGDDDARLSRMMIGLV